MKHAALAGALAGAALLFTAAALAQTVQRCETPDGKVTYSNGPCPSGSEMVRTLENDPGPTAADQKAARERAQQHSRELDKLERQRQKEEDKAARARAASDAKQAKRDVECKKLDAKLAAAREEFDTATLAKRQALGRKLRLAEEQAAACHKS